MPNLYDGYFINLDRSADRRERFEKQIETLGLSEIYRRFPAVDGSTLQPTKRLKARSVGAFLSHRNALVEAKNKRPFVHILEDDTIFSEQMAPAICFAIEHRLFDRFDVIFTDIAVQADLNFMRVLEASFESFSQKRAADFEPKDVALIDLQRFGFAGLPSYVIDARCIDRLVADTTTKFAAAPIFLSTCSFERRSMKGDCAQHVSFPFYPRSTSTTSW